MARLSVSSLQESFTLPQTPRVAPTPKAGFWCLGTDVSREVADVVNRSAPQTGRPWLVVIEKDRGNFTEQLKRFASPHVNNRGRYLLNASTQSEASSFVRTRAAKTPEEGRVLGARGEDVVFVTASELEGLLNRAAELRAEGNAFADAETETEPEPEPAAPRAFSAADFDALFDARFDERFKGVEWRLRKPTETLGGELLGCELFRAGVTGFVHAALEDRYHFDDEEAPQVHPRDRKRLRDEADPLKPVGQLHYPPAWDAIPGNPYAAAPRRAASPPLVDRHCVAVISGLDRASNGEPVDEVFRTFSLVAMESGAAPRNFGGLVVRKAVYKRSLFLRFGNASDCDQFIQAMNSSRTFGGKAPLWHKVAWHAPPKTHKFKTGRADDREILSKLN